MYRNSYFYDEMPLGSSLSIQDDIFKALMEGREKAEQIARALRVKIPTVTAGDIEIHCTTYDPQYWLVADWAKKPDTMGVVPGAKTLNTLRVS